MKAYQEWWLSPTERASVSVCSLRHILASPRYAPASPWDNRSKRHMDEKRIQCLSKRRSMYPYIFNHFPVIQSVSSKVRHFGTFLHILASSGYTPETIAVNVTRMERGFNVGQMHSIIIYPSIFNRLRAVTRYWSEIATFSYFLAFNAPVGVFPLEFRENVWS